MENFKCIKLDIGFKSTRLIYRNAESSHDSQRSGGIEAISRKIDSLNAGQIDEFVTKLQGEMEDVIRGANDKLRAVEKFNKLAGGCDPKVDRIIKLEFQAKELRKSVKVSELLIEIYGKALNRLGRQLKEEPNMEEKRAILSIYIKTDTYRMKETTKMRENQRLAKIAEDEAKSLSNDLD